MRLECHGVTVEVRSRLPDVHSWLAHDFSAFLGAPGGPRAGLVVSVARAGSKRFRGPYLPTPRSRVYSPGRRVRFPGAAWVRHDPARGRCLVLCDDAAAAYGACREVILSHLGEALGKAGLHRLHALGFAWGDCGVAVLGGSGTGKSALGVRILGDPRARFLSDDTPLVDKDGRLHPFADRIALSERPDGPPTRVYRHSGRRVKFLVAPAWFAGRIGRAVPLRWLVIARRRGDPRPRARRVGRWSAAWPLCRWLVLGHETPQVLELFLRPSPADVVSKAALLFGRARAAWSAVRSARVILLDLSPEPADGVAVLLDLIGPAVSATRTVRALGRSMWPVIGHGTVLELEPLPAGGVFAGDLVVYAGNRVEVCHRVIRTRVVDGVRWHLLKGDAKLSPDGWLPEYRITERVRAIGGRRADGTLFRLAGALARGLALGTPWRSPA